MQPGGTGQGRVPPGWSGWAQSREVVSGGDSRAQPGGGGLWGIWLGKADSGGSRSAHHSPISTPSLPPPRVMLGLAPLPQRPEHAGARSFPFQEHVCGILLSRLFLCSAWLTPQPIVLQMSSFHSLFIFNIVSWQKILLVHVGGVYDFFKDAAFSISSGACKAAFDTEVCGGEGRGLLWAY